MSAAYGAFAKATQETPQTQPILGRQSEMVTNNADGVVFASTPLQRFRRFLILGSEGPTYYASSQNLTDSNAKATIELFKSDDGPLAVLVLADVSDEGLAPKVSPALFALALALSYGTRATKRAAVKVFNTVVRTHSHLLEFVSYADSMRGWGRLMRETVANWYNSQPIDKLAYQVVKYRNRNAWTTRDVLRMAHPCPVSPMHSTVFGWAVTGEPKEDTQYPEIIVGFEKAKRVETPDFRLIKEYGLTHEMVPNTWLNDNAIWAQLLEKMPLTAMIRNLGKMTSIDLFTPMGAAEKLVLERLSNEEYIQKSRVHPFSILLASTTYASGHGVRGALSWKPNRRIKDALDKAFYLAFKNVVPTGKNYYLALDVSGSMSSHINNTAISCREASAAMAMAVARTEQNWYAAGFATSANGKLGGQWANDTSRLLPLNIGPNDSLATVCTTMQRIPMGGTDCSLPMLDALEKKIFVDTFVVFTDSETWAGKIHPVQALKKYRKAMNPNAKLVVMGMVSNNFTIADPKDPGMLDIVGLDSSAPQLIANFTRGDI